MNSKAPLAPVSHLTLLPAVSLETYATTPGFYMGDEDLKTGSHAYEVGSLLTESAPEPLAGEILC